MHKVTDNLEFDMQFSSLHADKLHQINPLRYIGPQHAASRLPTTKIQVKLMINHSSHWSTYPACCLLASDDPLGLPRPLYTWPPLTTSCGCTKYTQHITAWLCYVVLFSSKVPLLYSESGLMMAKTINPSSWRYSNYHRYLWQIEQNIRNIHTYKASGQDGLPL